MNKDRPVNLALHTIKFPVTAIVSIGHRISGVVIFLGLPCLLWLLQRALATPQGFSEVAQQLSTQTYKIITLIYLAAFLYHVIAGVRHLIMDFAHVGETLRGGKLGAWLVLLSSTIVIIFAGLWLWS